MPPIASLTRSLASYAFAIAAVSMVAIASVVHLEHAGVDRLAVVRAHEHRLTLTERLRWANEHKIAAGRGYLISGSPMFRHKLEEANARLEQLRRDLHRIEDEPDARHLLSVVDAASAAYDRAQDGVLALKERPHDVAELERLFERELLPSRLQLDRAIDAYIRRQDANVRQTYEQNDRQRARASLLALGSIGLAALLATLLAVLASRRLSRMYARERAALQQAEAALAARDEILGIVAHDLRNPLNAITMRAAFMKKKAETEELRHQAESIKSAGMQMDNLIKRLLDVSALEAGSFAVERDLCSVEPMVDQMIELFERLASAKSIHLRASVDEPGLSVFADREHVLQVLSNLLGNALKFTPEHGSVGLVVDRQHDFVRFSISDTGPGILPEDLPHVFHRFWKQDSPGRKTSRPSTKGTGLGLYIAKGIVEAHGGELWAESEPGVGAVFRFTLPMARHDSHGVSQEARDTGGGSPSLH